MNMIEQIRKEAKEFFEHSNGSHDWDHTERVYNTALHIGLKEGADLEVLQLAVLLHDLGRDEETKSKGVICHAKRSAEIAKEILERHSVDKVKIQKVLHCIINHRTQKDSKPETKEAKILFDADKIDALGATGVGRLFMFAGQINSRLHNKDVDLHNSEDYTREDTAYRYYLLHSRKLKERMFTDEGKRIAEQRERYMQEYFERLNNEIDGEI